MTARDAALTALLKIEEQGGYSNIVLDEMLTHADLSATERAMASRLLYGVIERRLTLDYLLNKTASTPVKQMQTNVREILRLAVYQLVYMDKTPAFAAINEAVGQTRRFGCGRLSGFVNGVLRRLEGEYPTLLDAIPNNDKGLEIRYSVPRVWIRAWRESYGEATMLGMLQSLDKPAPTYIRVNTVKTTTDAFCRKLTEHGVSWLSVEGLPDALEIQNASALHTLTDEMADCYYHQDLASQWCCRALTPQPGERIADLCAAPGGKTMTVAQMMHNTGEIFSGDIHAHKCRTLEKRAAQYGLSIVKVQQWDAAQLPQGELEGTFDRVLCDVPCSGMGVIRRKPEIRYKHPDDFAELPALQRTILEQGAKLVRPGGVLQYSTCTLRPEENEQIVEGFLSSHPEFSPRLLPMESCFAASDLPVSHAITLFPHIHGTDGFFVAGFMREV